MALLGVLVMLGVCGQAAVKKAVVDAQPAEVEEGIEIGAIPVPLVIRGEADVNSVAWSPDGTRLATGSSDNTVRTWTVRSGTELRRFEGHSAPVLAVSWSPDGKQIASSSSDKTSRVWDTATGVELLLLEGHSNEVMSISWSPDGARLATGSSDNTVRVWDASTGVELHRLTGHKDAVRFVSWSPDGAWLASASYDHTVRVWDVASGAELRTLEGHTGRVLSVTWSPDGQLLASCSDDHTVRVWDASTGGEVRAFEGHSNPIWSVAWSPDGRWLATGSTDNTLRVWDATTGRELRRMDGHSNPVWSVAWSPDGSKLASGSGDNSLRVWDASAQLSSQGVEGHSNTVWSVAWSPDGTKVASGSYDDDVRVWDAATGERLRVLEGHASPVRSISWSPDGTKLASGSQDRTVRVWDAATGASLRTLEGHSSSVWSVSWSPDGTRLASGSLDGTARIWDTATGAPLLTLDGHSSPVFSVSWSPDGTRLATGSFDKSLRIWDAATGALLRTLEGHSGSVTSVSWSPDGLKLVSGSDDKTVRVWDIAAHTPPRTLDGHAFAVRSVSWCQDGTKLASGSDDGSVRVWDAAIGAQLRTMEGHSNTVGSVAWSPDGTKLASGSTDDAVIVWDSATGAVLLRFGEEWPPVRDVAWSPDGSLLASGSEDGTVHIWSARTEEAPRVLTGHTDTVLSVAWSPDGTRLLSGAEDGPVIQWDVASGSELHRTEGHTDAVFSVAWNRDGTQFATGAGDGNVTFWDASTVGELRRLKATTLSVPSVAWSPIADRLAIGLSDNTIRIWDAAGSEVRRIEGHLDWVFSLSWSADGARLASASADGTVRVWDANNGAELLRFENSSRSFVSVEWSPDGTLLASASTDNAVHVWDSRTGQELRRLEGHTHLPTSISWSPDGTRLASASSDGTIRLWNPTTGAPLAILSPGPDGSWYAWHANGRLTWAQPRTDLQIWKGFRDGWVPLLPPKPSGEPSLSLVTSAVTVPDGGGAADTVVTLRNTGSAPAFEIHLDPSLVPPGLSVVPQSWRSRLDPGASVDIPVSVTYLTPLTTPRGPPSPHDLSIPLTAHSTWADSAPTPLSIRVAAAVPVVADLVPTLDANGETVGAQVTLANDGAAYPQPLKVALRFLDTGGETLAETPSQDIPLLPATGRLDPLSFTLPEAVRGTETQVAAVIAGSIWSSHTWVTTPQPLVAQAAWRFYLTLSLAFALVLGAATYQVVYRHPLVLRLVADPTQIRALPSADVAAADRVLRRARKLPTLLQSAAIPPDRWSALLDASGADPAPISAVLGATLGSGETLPDGLVLHPLTLPPMPVKIEARTALVLRTTTPAANLVPVLKAAIEARNLQSAHVLLVDLSPAQDAAAALRDSYLRVTVINGRALTRLVLSADPRTELASLVASTARLGEISPYQTGGGVDNPLLFFGRTSELALLGGREARNHLLIGARQMGKSSILKELVRRSPGQAWLVTLTGGDLDRDLARAGVPTIPDLEARDPTDAPPFLLLDEADLLVRDDRDAGYPLLRRLRALSETGRCRFVLSGYWRLHHAAYLEHQSPIRNFAEPLRIGPLDPDAARDLATRPLEPLGVRWDDGLVDVLLERTGRRANLVAITCNAAVKSLPPLSDRRLTRAILDAVVDVGSDSGKEIADALGDRGSLTADARASAVDLLCQYAALTLETPFSRTDLRHRLDAAGASLPETDVREAVERLLLSYTWTLDGGTFRWPVPLLRAVLLQDCDGDAAAMLDNLVRQGTWKG